MEKMFKNYINLIYLFLNSNLRFSSNGRNLNSMEVRYSDKLMQNYEKYIGILQFNIVSLFIIIIYLEGNMKIIRI